MAMSVAAMFDAPGAVGPAAGRAVTWLGVGRHWVDIGETLGRKGET